MIESIQSKLQQLARSKRARIIGIPLVAFVALAAVAAPHAMSLTPKPGQAAAAAPTAYQVTLRNQVQTGNGAPASGRNPAAQTQSKLTEAASRPNGTGTRTDKPAAGISGDHKKDATYSDVYGDPKKTGIDTAGCLIDYGIPGQECLPAHHISADGTLSCDEVHEHFPKGIKVTGTDRYHIDHNGDKLACGPGD